MEASVLSRIDAAIKTLYCSTSTAERNAADVEMKSILGSLVQFPPESLVALSQCQLMAGSPVARELMLALLHRTTSPWTSCFAAAAITFCVDNFWASISDDDRYGMRTSLLQWIAARGVEAAPQARASALTALARITKLAFRHDSRHYETVGDALQFLGQERGSGHIALGLELVCRLTEDMPLPHPALSDPTSSVRLLLFRDIALRPFATRLVGLQQEALDNAVATLRAACADDGGAIAALPPLLRLATKVLNAMTTVLSYRFSLGSGHTHAANDDAGQEEEHDESSTIQLPSSWAAFATHAPLAAAATWLRFSLMAHAAYVTAAPGSALAGMEVPILSLACSAVTLLGTHGATKSSAWGHDTLRARRALFVRSFTTALKHTLAAPPAARAGLLQSGFLHSLSRAIFRMKIALPLVYLFLDPAEGHDFAVALTAFTLAAYSRDTSAAWPPAFASGENTCYYLRSAWLMCLMPAALLHRDDAASHALRSAVPTLLQAMLDRHCPRPRRAAGVVTPSSWPGLVGTKDDFTDDGDGKDEDAALGEDLDVGADAANAAEQVEDDAVELVAEVGRFASASSVRESTERLQECSAAIVYWQTAWERASGPGAKAAAAACLARWQKRLSWMLRFSTLLCCTLLEPSAMEVAEEEDDDERVLLQGGGRTGGATLSYGEGWVHPSLVLDGATVMAAIRREAEGWGRALLAPLAPGYTPPRAASPPPPASRAARPSRGSALRAALRADAAVTGEVPGVGRSTLEGGMEGLGMGVTAPAIHAAPVRAAPAGGGDDAMAVAGRLGAGAAEEEEDTELGFSGFGFGQDGYVLFDDEDEKEAAEAGGEGAEADLLRLYGVGGDAEGRYGGSNDSAADLGGPWGVNSPGFRVNFGANPVLAGMLALPFPATPVPSMGELHAARMGQINGVGSALAAFSGRTSSSWTAPKRITPERLCAGLCKQVLLTVLSARGGRDATLPPLSQRSFSSLPSAHSSSFSVGGASPGVLAGPSSFSSTGGRGIEMSGEGEEGREEAGGEDAALAAELEAVGARLLSRLRLAEGGGAAAGVTRPPALPWLPTAPPPTPSPNPVLTLTPAAYPWTPAALSLELSILAFTTAFVSWYAVYRTAAGAVLLVREGLRAQGRTGELVDMPLLSSRFPVNRGETGSTSLGRTTVLVNGRLVSVDAMDGILMGLTGQGGPEGEGGQSARSASVMLSAWLLEGGSGARNATELLERTEKEQEHNLLLLLGELLGGLGPVDLLDGLTAKVVETLQRAGPRTPAVLLAASLECLHGLALGVTAVLPHDESGAALLASPGPIATSHGFLGLDFSTPPPALPSVVGVGDDLLHTACVKALLRRPGSMLFPVLAMPRHAKLRSLLYGTLTRLLFLHVKLLAAPPAALLPGRQATAPGPVVGEEQLELGEHGAGETWFAAYTAPITARVHACRGGLGLPTAPATGGDDIAGWEAAVDGAARTGPPSAASPAALALKPALIGVLRDLRGVVSAAATSLEFRLVTEWLAGCGVYALMAATARLYRGRAHADVLVPLLRLAVEVGSNRDRRAIFPPDSALGYGLVRACAVTGSAVAASLALDAGAPASTSSSHLKLAFLILLLASRILPPRGVNHALPAAYGDSAMSDFAAAALSTWLAVPVDTWRANAKALRASLSAGLALLTWGAPLPTYAAPHGPGGALMTVPQSTVDIGCGLAPGAVPSPGAALPFPSTVLALLRLPAPMLAALLARLAAGLDLSVAGAEGVAAAVDSLEAIMMLETEARTLLALANEPDARGAAFRAAPRKLVRCPSGTRLTPECAAFIVRAMDAAASVPAALCGTVGQGGGTWAATASGATGGTWAGGPEGGVLGLDFMVLLLLEGAKEAGPRGSLAAWGLGRIVFLSLLCRPSVFEAAARGIVPLAAPELQEAVAHSFSDLAAHAEMLDGPTEAATMDSFASAFVRWTREVASVL